MVYRARGIEEVKDDLDNSELIEDTSEENNKGEEESQEMLNHGDSQKNIKVCHLRKYKNIGTLNKSGKGDTWTLFTLSWFGTD